MNRLDLKMTGMIVTVLFMAQLAGTQPAENKIGYMREQAPFFEIPDYMGERYEDLVPDTYDIAERARLAIEGLTRTTDPNSDYDIYFVSLFYQNPPVLRHQFSDICSVKYQEALPLLRTITGSRVNEHVDRAWMESILKSIGPDGLYYISTQGRPWLQGSDMYSWCPNICWADGTIEGPRGRTIDQFTDSVLMGRILAPLMIYHLRDRNPLWTDAIDQMIQRLSELVIEQGDIAYLPARLFVPDAKLPPEAEMPVGMWAEELGGRLIQGFAQVYQATGHESARRLAGKLVNYFRYHGKFFDEHGRFVYPAGDGTVKVGGHFHAHTIGLLAMLDYALAVGDQELMGFVRRSFEWARDNAYGSALVGWFPESAQADYPVCELCCVADMIALALKLTEAGVGDYWDDADRWLRNQFAEGQFTRTDWIDRAAASAVPKPVSDNETAEDVARRHLGTFTGYCTGNDYGIEYGAPTGMAACCAGNSARTIYYVWARILDYAHGRLRVNLPLNRASAWADVHSHLPYVGRLDVKVKRPLEQLWIRVPEWIETGGEEVACSVDGESRSFRWKGRYVDVGSSGPGEVVTLTFPIRERTVTNHRLGKADYTLVLKGNDVVLIDPPGEYHGLYQREHYRGNQTRWVKRERFVSDDIIRW